MKTRPDVVDRFLEVVRTGEFMEALPSLYAPGIVSVHGDDAGGTVVGLEALGRRMQARRESVQGDPIHADGPYLMRRSDGGGLRFALVFEREWAGPDAGPLERMVQLAVFHVEDDLIVREEVFLQPAG